jgi:hypothetical protein
MSARCFRFAGLALTLIAANAFAAPSVTVYSHDLGFVRDTRTIETGARGDTVLVAGVPERVDFSSVRVALADATLRVTRLAYRYDVANGDALIQNAKGRRVRVTSRGDRATEGVLVGTDGSFLVVRADDGTLTAVAREALETVRLTDPPPALALRPSIEAVIPGIRRGRSEAELSYLTGGLSWSAEHTVVRRGESSATWATNVTIDNQTGVAFENANVKLVAGSPNRATPPPIPYMARNQAKEMLAAADAGGMAEQAFADYHLYTLNRPATLRDRETQSLVMHDPRDVKATSRYFYRGGDPRGVTTQLEVKNDAASGLGLPLPAGRVRFYEADASGALQFTGETTIGHTAEGEKLSMDVGHAFDLVAERKEMSNKRISDREREVSVAIELRNRKKTAVTITVQENLGGDIEILKSSLPSRRKDANTVEFDVPVAAGKEVTLTYTYRARY